MGISLGERDMAAPARRPPILEISNLGPIRYAKFPIRRMTVLLGPNNSGKSMLSTFLYAVGKGIGDYQKQGIRSPYLLERVLFEEKPQPLDELAYALLVSERPRLMNFVHASLTRTFGGAGSHLVRWGSAELEAKLQLSNVIITISKKADSPDFRVSCKLRAKPRIMEGLGHLSSLKRMRDFATKGGAGADPTLIRRQLRFELLEPSHGRYNLARDLAAFMIAGTEGTALRNPSYLLAERAGLVRIYRPLLAAYMRASLPTLVQAQRQHHVPLTKLLQELGSSSLQIPVLAGDFLEDFLLSRPSVGSRDNERARDRDRLLEEIKEIMEGEISVSENLEMTYKQQDRTLDIAFASSMVAEIAPLYQIMKNGNVDALIIEEPEAHLHVAKQYRFARVLSYLQAMQLGTFITTHSVTLPIALAHMTALGKISSRKVRDLGYSPTMAIEPSDLGVLWLKRDASGNTVEEIGISPNGTIERLPEADEILQLLYQEEERITSYVDPDDSPTLQGNSSTS